MNKASRVTGWIRAAGLAAGEMEAEEIDQGDGVEKRNLALQGPVALAQQRPSERGLRLPGVEEAAHPEPDAVCHRAGVAETG